MAGLNILVSGGTSAGLHAGMERALIVACNDVGMILALDANFLAADFLCQTKFWSVLAHAPNSWGLRVVVPEVALAEVVGLYRASVARESEKLKSGGKEVGRLGLQDLLDDTIRKASESASQYEEKLREALKLAKVEVLQPSPIPHMTLVERAVQRRRPCDDKGDGYRDSLNWLTLLELAANNPDETVVWVSRDGDFWDLDKSGFHSDLLEDLTRAGIVNVRIARDAWTDVLNIAGVNSHTRDMSALGDQLLLNTAREFLQEYLTAHADRIRLLPREAALPPATKDSSITAIDNIRDLAIEDGGGVGSGKAVVGFTLCADVAVTLRVPVTMMTEMNIDEVGAIEDGDARVPFQKSLVIRGVLEVNQYGRPTSAEVTDATALPSDPMKEIWDAADKDIAKLQKRTPMDTQLLAQLYAFNDRNRKLIEQVSAVNALTLSAWQPSVWQMSLPEQLSESTKLGISPARAVEFHASLAQKVMAMAQMGMPNENLLRWIRLGTLVEGQPSGGPAEERSSAAGRDSSRDETNAAVEGGTGSATGSSDDGDSGGEIDGE